MLIAVRGAGRAAARSAAAAVGRRSNAEASLGRRRAPFLLLIGLFAGVNASDASAAALGSVATSAGLLATLLAVFAMKGWPSLVSASTVSTASGALLVAAALVWLLPARPSNHLRVVKIRGWIRAARRLRADPAAWTDSGSASDAAHPALRTEFTALFLRVHHAWDQGALDTLHDCIAPELMAELVGERVGASGEGPVTEFRAVAAEVVGLESLAGVEIASVAFSGMLCEAAGEGFVPFRELWLLTRPEASGAGWRLARHQVLY